MPVQMEAIALTIDDHHVFRGFQKILSLFDRLRLARLEFDTLQRRVRI